MPSQQLERLNYLCEIVPSLLSSISEQHFSEKSSPTKWSKKEILGHLIDSATNNHQRLIRAQYENDLSFYYDQNQWNALSFYNERNSKDLIGFWTLYNKHLLEIVKHISPDNLTKVCNGHTLEWIFNDYVEHLEHHLKQLIDY
ncbi:DinB superfamily protein [compost metagenome]